MSEESNWIPITDADMLGEPNGVATLDANSKVVQSIPHGKVDGLGSLALKNSLTAADVGARPDNWMPTAAQVGARADTWKPAVADIPTLPADKISGLTTALDDLTTNKVSTGTKINGQALTGDITLNASDVGARASNWMPTAAQVGARASNWTPAVDDIPVLPADKIKSGTFDADRIPKLPQSKITDLTEDLASKVPNTLKVNGRPLSEDITLTTEDVRVANKTSLPATGQPGQIINCNGTLYIWKG